MSGPRHAFTRRHVLSILIEHVHYLLSVLTYIDPTPIQEPSEHKKDQTTAEKKQAAEAKRKAQEAEKNRKKAFDGLKAELKDANQKNKSTVLTRFYVCEEILNLLSHSIDCIGEAKFQLAKAKIETGLESAIHGIKANVENEEQKAEANSQIEALRTAAKAKIEEKNISARTGGADLLIPFVAHLIREKIPEDQLRDVINKLTMLEEAIHQQHSQGEVYIEKKENIDEKKEKIHLGQLIYALTTLKAAMMTKLPLDQKQEQKNVNNAPLKSEQEMQEQKTGSQAPPKSEQEMVALEKREAGLKKRKEKLEQMAIEEEKELQDIYDTISNIPAETAILDGYDLAFIPEKYVTLTGMIAQIAGKEQLVDAVSLSPVNGQPEMKERGDDSEPTTPTSLQSSSSWNSLSSSSFSGIQNRTSASLAKPNQQDIKSFQKKNKLIDLYTISKQIVSAEMEKPADEAETDAARQRFQQLQYWLLLVNCLVARNLTSEYQYKLSLGLFGRPSRLRKKLEADLEVLLDRGLAQKLDDFELHMAWIKNPAVTVDAKRNEHYLKWYNTITVGLLKESIVNASTLVEIGLLTSTWHNYMQNSDAATKALLLTELQKKEVDQRSVLVMFFDKLAIQAMHVGHHSAVSDPFLAYITHYNAVDTASQVKKIKVIYNTFGQLLERGEPCFPIVLDVFHEFFTMSAPKLRQDVLDKLFDNGTLETYFSNVVNSAVKNNDYQLMQTHFTGYLEQYQPTKPQKSYENKIDLTIAVFKELLRVTDPKIISLTLKINKQESKENQESGGNIKMLARTFKDFLKTKDKKFRDDVLLKMNSLNIYNRLFEKALPSMTEQEINYEFSLPTIKSPLIDDVETGKKRMR